MTLKDNIEQIGKETNPYPETVFKSITDDIIARVVTHLNKGGFSSDALFGYWGRNVWNNCSQKIAEEISSLVYEREFVEWKDNKTPSIYYNSVTKLYSLYGLSKRFTLDELHEYWLTIKTE